MTCCNVNLIANIKGYPPGIRENGGQYTRFEMKVRYRSARYEILVENPGSAGRGTASAQLDDTVIVERPLRVPPADDGNTHHLRVRLG